MSFPVTDSANRKHYWIVSEEGSTRVHLAEEMDAAVTIAKVAKIDQEVSIQSRALSICHFSSPTAIDTGYVYYRLILSVEHGKFSYILSSFVTHEVEGGFSSLDDAVNSVFAGMIGMYNEDY